MGVGEAKQRSLNFVTMRLEDDVCVHSAGTEVKGRWLPNRAGTFVHLDLGKLHLTEPSDGERYRITYFTSNKWHKASEEVQLYLEGLGFVFPPFGDDRPARPEASKE